MSIPAEAWNEMLDLVERTRPAAGYGTPAASLQLGPQFVIVKNLGDADLERFAPVGIEAAVYTPPTGAGSPDRWVSNLALGGRAADPEQHGDLWGIARGTIKPGKFGIVQHMGLCALKVDRGDPAGGFVDIQAGLSLVKGSAVPGKPIVWIDPDDELLERYAIVDLGLGRPRSLKVILGDAQLVPGETARWRYQWSEAIIDGDPSSITYLQYVAKTGGLSSVGSGGAQDPARMALNRLEAHHIRDPIDRAGIEGKLGVGPVCDLPGVLHNCPPARTLEPRLRPIPAGVCVEIHAERTTRGDGVWVFGAMPCAEIADPLDGNRKFNLIAKGASA